MTTRRVVITGVGVVNPAVTGGFAALAARLGAAEAELGAAAPGAPDGALANPFALEGLIDDTEARRLSRVCQLAVAAARLALTDANLSPIGDLGVVVGSEFGDLSSTIEFANGYLQRGPVGVSALLFPNTVMNVMTATTAIAVAAKESALTLNAPFVAGELAIARARAAVAAGRLDVALAGGVDELEPLTARTLPELGETSVRAEGATFVVLESLRSAQARGVPVLGEIVAAACRVIRSRPHGVGRTRSSSAIAVALDEARMTSAELGWIYASRSGDRARERWEQGVLATALAPHRPPIASLSGLVGQHSGLGPLHVAAAAWTVGCGRLPMAVDRWDLADPDPVPAGRGMPVPPGPGLVHGLARGGTHVALVVGPPSQL